MSKHSLLRLFVMLCFVMAASAVMAAAPDRFVIDTGWCFRLAPGNAQLAAHPEAAAWQAAGEQVGQPPPVRLGCPLVIGEVARHGEPVPCTRIDFDFMRDPSG